MVISTPKMPPNSRSAARMSSTAVTIEHDALHLAADSGSGQQAPQELLDRRDRSDDQAEEAQNESQQEVDRLLHCRSPRCSGRARTPPIADMQLALDHAERG